jgi:hypothetical protein
VIDQNITALLTAAEHYRHRVNCDAICTGSARESCCACRPTASRRSMNS